MRVHTFKCQSMKHTVFALITTTLFLTPTMAREAVRYKDAYALREAQKSQVQDNPYYGVWKTEAKGEETKTAYVKLGPCADAAENLCGKIVHLDEPTDPKTGLPKTDKNNRNKDLRDRPIMGLSMVYNLKPDGKGGYTDGTIYSPKSGKTYDASVKLNPDSSDLLDVTGHVLFFSSTQTWTRIKPKPTN